MRIAIAATNCHFDAQVSSHFGHCQCFVILDTITSSVSFMPNPFWEEVEKAGERALLMLIEQGVRKIISREFGKNIQPLMDRNNIQMIVVTQSDLKVENLLTMLKKTYSDSIKPIDTK